MNGKAARRTTVLAGLLLTLIGLVAPGAVCADALLWASGAGGDLADQAKAVAVDTAGNTLVTGFFSGSATFGRGEENETTLTAAGDHDLFIAKHSQSGKLLWVKQAGGVTPSSFGDMGYAIAVDPTDNILVTGAFLSSATFGAGEDNETRLTSTGGFDVFIAKYAPDGTLLWAKGSFGGGSNFGYGLAADAVGNVLVTGSIEGSATFGRGEGNKTTLTAALKDVFLAKYAPNGTLLWATNAGGMGLDEGYAVAVDGSNNILVTGYFVDIATFGLGDVSEVTLSGDEADIFIAKYDPDGSLLWARPAGGTLSERSLGIAVDRSNNVLVTGFFGMGVGVGSATFGHGEASETTLNTTGLRDCFIAKYAPNGSLIWSKKAGGPNNDECYAIAVDRSGNTLITGIFFQNAVFGPGEDNEVTLTGVGTGDLVVAKYAADGTLRWATSAGGSAVPVLGYGIGVDAVGDALVTGLFRGSATFGLGEINETTLTAVGGVDDSDIFIAKYAGTGADVQAAVGVWRPSNGRFRLDTNGNGRWDGTDGGDTLTGVFGMAGDVPIIGDWDGDGRTEVGYWRPSDRRFRLDANGNNRWDGPAGGDRVTCAFGAATDIPVTGDWDGDGRTEVGVWRPSLGLFLLDFNANGCWDGVAGGDRENRFGAAGDHPVAGDWNGDGRSEVGVWRPATGKFLLDVNGNGRWDGAAGGDTLTGWFGLSSDRPAIGDWNGDGRDEVGFWRPDDRRFRLDANGNDRWDGSSGGDRVTAAFGPATDVPVAGKW